MNETSCPACHHVVPAGRFCGVCGLELLHATPAPEVAVSAPTSSPTAVVLSAEAGHTALLAQPDSASLVPPGAASGSNESARASRKIGLGTIAAVLLAAGAYVVFGIDAKHTITGDLSLTDSSVTSMTTGESCTGQNGYEDIQPGADVDLYDQNGTTISTTQLGSGTFDGASCVFDFRFSGVAKKSFYKIEVSHRGQVTFDYSDLVKNSWVAHLTIGS